MPPAVPSGAQILCTFGTAPAPLNVIPKGPPVMIEGKLAATVMDIMPMANIPSFGPCLSPANPVNIKPIGPVPGSGPCVPVITGPWLPGGPTVLINGTPALDNASKCICSWGGVVSVLVPALKTLVP